MSLRKLTLIVLALTFVLSSSALFAQLQAPHFILSGTTFEVRQHGQTEDVGDLTMTCDVSGTFLQGNNTAATATNPVSFTVVLSPIFGIVNAADTVNTFSFASNTAINARIANIESETTGATIGNVTIINAALNTSATNSITVQLFGTAAAPATTGAPATIIRISGIRVNIADANLPVATQVLGTIIATPPGAFQIDNVNNFPVAFVQDEIKVSVTPADALLICQPRSSSTGDILVSERFPSALTTVTDENDAQHKPSGVGVDVGSPAPKAASKGTQLTITIGSVLPGVTVSWPITVGGPAPALELTLVDPTTTSFTNTSATAVANTSFVYFTDADIVTISESVTIPVTFTPSAIPVPPVFGTITASVTLGPNASGGPFSSTVSSSKILSFVKNPLNGPPPDAIETLNACVTNLLCKFLSTATGAVAGGGYDTGIAIANSSLDIFGDPLKRGGQGAVRQQGVCRVHLFGS
ncbi:MAG: hypothetical protein WBN92_08790, partial [Terriglobia bacterium]